MADDQRSLEARVELLTTELALLRQRVEQVAAFAGAPALPGEAAGSAFTPGTLPPTIVAATTSEEEESSTWERESSRLLSRASTVSFLLVLALIMRMITDSSIVPPQMGSLIGIGYAGIILAVGWFM